MSFIRKIIIRKILKSGGFFLHDYVSPLLAPLFTLVNYVSFNKFIEKKNFRSKDIILILLDYITLFYFLLTLVLSLWQLFNQIENKLKKSG